MKHYLIVGLLSITMVTSSFGEGVRIEPNGGGGYSGRSQSSGGRIGGGGNGGHGTRAAGAPVILKMQRMRVPRPDIIRNPQHVVRDNRHINWPTHDESGSRITQRASTLAPQQHTTIVRNSALVSNIQRQQRVEIVPNRYYWHTANGIRYAHYYDHDIHWYGFYYGPSFYWTRYYGNRWWWFDVSFNRWVYWWDGFWWWPAPTGVMYVYVDNSYYPYENEQVIVKKPEVAAPPMEIPSSNEGHTYNSPDGQRMIQVFGSEAEAFLYDKSAGNPVFLKYLGKNVDKVRYTGGTQGKVLQILIDYKDGNFALFTADGDPVDAEAPEAIPPPPAEPPPAVPATK